MALPTLNHLTLFLYTATYSGIALVGAIALEVFCCCIETWSHRDDDSYH